MVPGIEAGRRYGDYVVEGPLGEGGMAVVVRARHQHTGEVVALKILTAIQRAEQPGILDRMHREAAVLQALAEIPYVVGFVDQLHDAATHDDVIVLEFINGQVLSAVKGADLAQIVEWMGYACHALNDMHSVGYVHRDLKPDNLMWVPDADPPLRVIDFNSAGPVRAANSRLTQMQGAFPNTPAFLAPECFQGAAADRSADIYALGICFSELLIGRHPLVEGDEPQTNAGWQQLHEHTAFPHLPSLRPEIPEKLQSLLAAATAKRPEDRIPNAAELWRRLESVWKELNAPPVALASAPVAPAPVAPAPAARTPRFGIAAAAALLLLGGVGFGALKLAEINGDKVRDKAEIERLQRIEQQARQEQARVEQRDKLAAQKRAEAKKQEAKAEEKRLQDLQAEAVVQRKTAPPARPAPRPVRTAPPPAPKPTPEPKIFKQRRGSTFSVNNSPVRFRAGSTGLRSSSYDYLDNLAQNLLDHPQYGAIEIGVHSDNVGSEARNRELCERRAAAVRAYLLLQGVSPSRLVAKGFGSTRPIASNSTPEGRAKNRRVDFNSIR